VIAENGKIGVEMVRKRMQTGQKPYDLIFMDIFMPVMGGVEAAAKITELDTGTPIIAMTANIMTSELDKYKENGMSDFIGTPYTSQDLWRCLLKYLTPVSVSVVNEDDHKQDIDELQKKLCAKFVKDNQDKYAEITGAIASDELTLAHRLAHTLKSNAGQIGKFELQNTAAEIEDCLQNQIVPSEELVRSLGIKLSAVLEELASLINDSADQAGQDYLDAGQVLTLIEKLEPLLRSRNSECINLLDDIRAIPGAEGLALQIEKYNFKLAAQTLAELKKGWM
jgi:CheY-like chemotaxis protein